MSIRRERDARRVAKSVRTHEATMKAYSNASGWERYDESDRHGAMAGRILPIKGDTHGFGDQNNRGFNVGKGHAKTSHILKDIRKYRGEVPEGYEAEDITHAQRVAGDTHNQKLKAEDAKIAKERYI
jgi:hypothetical protein